MYRRPLSPPHRKKKNLRLFTGYEAEAFEPSVAPCKRNYQGATIQRFKSSDIPRAQWNGAFRLHSPEPNHLAFGFCSCKQNTKERCWVQQFLPKWPVPIWCTNRNFRNCVEWKETQDTLGLYGGLILVVIVFIVYIDWRDWHCLDNFWIVRLVNSLHSGYDLIGSG